jgi:hypothetical protein
MDECKYLFVQTILPADINFTFDLMGDWTNDYFSLLDDSTIETNHGIINLFSFNDKSGYQPLP